MKIDKNDAPKGAIAVEELDDCNGCMYYDGGVGCLMCRPDVKCCSDERRDGHDVIFKPAPKAYKRDSNGRFTSAESEARKQLIDKAQFPAFAESVKAMTGETITQTLGKKQVEIESNGKHVQTNAEKYAKENAVEFIKAHSKSGGLNATIENVYNVLSKPAEQDWPEWCKVGAWIAWNTGGKTVFRKIKSVEAVLCLDVGVITRSMMDEGGYFPARVRPFTAKEAVDLVGKKIFFDGFNLKFAVTEVVFNENGCRVHRSSDACYTLGLLAAHTTFEDGKPCGVLEVVK